MCGGLGEGWREVAGWTVVVCYILVCYNLYATLKINKNTEYKKTYVLIIVS